MKSTRKGKRIALAAGLIVALLAASIGFIFRAEIRTWYVLFPHFESLGRNAQGLAEYRHRKSDIVMVSLPGGRFVMGAHEEDKFQREENETPLHEVTLSPFIIAKFEVTQEQWSAVMGTSPSKLKGDKLPVEQVSWNDCKAFCEKVGLALPTEAEWEYACRAGTTTSYSTGDSKKDLSRVGWHAANSGDRPHTVGEKPANPWGLHDMHGNSGEWCEDLWDKDFYGKPEASGKDPLCRRGYGHRVIRGGTWGSDGFYSRSAYRFKLAPTEQSSSISFRPVWRHPE